MQTLKTIDPCRLLFFDIETAPSIYRFDDLQEPMRSLWAHKAKNIMKTKPYETVDESYQEAGIYAEFARVVCISMGMLAPMENGTGYSIKLSSFFGESEKEILERFATQGNKLFAKGQSRADCLAGHNIKEFDIPFLCRRFLINGLQIPDFIDCTGLRPWEVPHIDTMEHWKFGDYKAYTTLNLLAACFGIESPKDDISGADVARVFYEENDSERIAKYCELDVLTVAQFELRWKGLPLIEAQNILLPSKSNAA
jgi:predicted PolB exonuclease-like 3'-5' exonuclease